MVNILNQAAKHNILMAVHAMEYVYNMFIEYSNNYTE